MRTEHQILLAPLTTLAMGGAARTFVTLEREADVIDALRDVRKRQDSFFVLGGGSNIVIADSGYAGSVLKMGITGVLSEVEEAESVLVDVAAGESWDDLVAHTVASGWSGLESLSGIPGQVGASPIQNIGAYGNEVAACVKSLRAFDTETGTFVTFSAADCRFGYRTSQFKHSTRWIVTSVCFRLARNGGTSAIRYKELGETLGVQQGCQAPLSHIRGAVIHIRRQKSMLYDPADPDSWSAGSFMMNPILSVQQFKALELRADGSVPHYLETDGRVKVPAAWLIERAGFSRGMRRGRVGISSKHCLALVNFGQGTAQELLQFADEIRTQVYAKFGVQLSLEPVVISGD